MGLFKQLAGTMASFLQVGGPGGPGWNDNAGALEAKNSSNSAFANARGADPVGPNDFVTLEYGLGTAGTVSNVQGGVAYEGTTIFTTSPATQPIDTVGSKTTVAMVNTSGGAVILQLPNPATNVGRTIMVKDQASSFDIFNCTVEPFSTEDIDEIPNNLVLSIKNQEVWFTSDGTNWNTNYVPMSQWLGSTRHEYWDGEVLSTQPTGQYGCSLESAGGGAPAVLTSASLLTSTKRSHISSTGLAQYGILDESAVSVWRGNAAGLGGFRFVIRFSIESVGGAAGNPATYNTLFGLISSAGLVLATSTNWTTQTTLASIGVGFATTTFTGTPNGNWQLIFSNGSTAPTLVNTGIAITTTSLLQLELFCNPNDTKIFYRFTDLSANHVFSGFATGASLPPATTFLGLWGAAGWASGATGTTTVGFARYSLEAPN